MPIGPHIVDFFCPQHRLIVEVDGGQHESDDDDGDVGNRASVATISGRQGGHRRCSGQAPPWLPIARGWPAACVASGGDCRDGYLSLSEQVVAGIATSSEVPVAPKRSISKVTLVIASALVAGVVFRLFYPGAIEFHGDERFSFYHVMTVLHGGPWPALGMTMSVGGPNPGMSVWIFILLGLVAQPDTPVGLAQAVQVLNITALIAFVVFVVRSIPRDQRESWLWAAALWAVNPIAIIYERKIWPPSTLPIFIVVMLAAWWHRRSWLGSFLFAFVTVLGGQIHPTCAFLGFSLFAWTIVDDRRSFRIAGLIPGAVIGFLPTITWLARSASVGGGLETLRLPLANFYGRWFTTPFGYGPDHVLGPVEFPRFLGWPETDSGSTWLVLAIYVAIIAVALALTVPAAWRYLRAGNFSLRWILLGETPAGRVVRAAFFGLGMILTLLTIRGGGLYPHYMIVITPIMTLWVALTAMFGAGGVLGRRTRMLLATLCALDAAVVVLLFSYIHTVGDIYGEFGPSWEWQQSHPDQFRDRLPRPDWPAVQVPAKRVSSHAPPPPSAANSLPISWARPRNTRRPCPAPSGHPGSRFPDAVRRETRPADPGSTGL